MKSKRYTTEVKIRILREADAGGRAITVLRKKKNLSEDGSNGGSRSA